MTDETQDGVLFLSGDLMFASRVRAAADSAGLGFRLAGNLPADPDSTIRYVVLDLATRSKIVDAVGDGVGSTCPKARCIAYGPHVQVQALKAAREAGIETVLTRGQFDSMLGSLFRSESV